MSVRMLLGRAGSGKTIHVLDEIREKLRSAPDDAPLILLVPDQMTFDMEYRLATTPGLGGMSRAQVFSFSRLAVDVLGETGGLTRTHVSRVGIHMLLRKVIEHRKPELKVYQRASQQQGFYQMLEEMVTELKRYCFTAQDLVVMRQNITAQLSGKQQGEVLADKLHDLQLIYADLEEALAGKYIDSEDAMQLLVDHIPQADSLRGAEVWVDGFYSFTPQEYGVLHALAKSCQRLSVTLTMDPEMAEKTPGLFRPSAITYRNLHEMVEDTGVELAPPLLFSDAKRFTSPALAHLEAYYEKRPPKPSNDDTGVTLQAAVTRRSEVEGTAREIIHLVRDEGLRYRDTAILVRDPGTYRDLISTVFEDYGIPAFLDQKRTMRHHPLLELVHSSLEVIEQNWRYEPVFRCVKTDLLFPPDAGPLVKLRDDMDRLENYVLAYGIGGSHWTQKELWHYRRYRGLDDTDSPQTDQEKKIETQLNHSRSMIVAPLERLQRDMRQAKTTAERCEALFLYLEALEVPQKIEGWRNQAEDAGRLEEAREHDQVWGAIIEMLDQVVEMAGAEEVSLEVFAKMIETGLDSMRFSLVPPALDQVLIGSLDRTRSVDVHHVFVLGANDGVLPARPEEDGFLTEDEREWLEDEGVELAPSSRQRLLDEEFLIYLALAGVKERLWVSYPLADDEGKSLQPSILINQLKGLFPNLEEGLILATPEEADNESALAYVTGPRQALVYALGQIRQWKRGYPIQPVWWDVYNALVARDDGLGQGRLLFGGLFYRNREDRLSPETSRQLYGDTIQASVSRMERFSACPFQQFAANGLRLREREIYRLEAPDIGQLFHSALSMMADSLRQQNKDWGRLDDAECLKLAETFVDELTPKLQREILLSSNRHHYIARKLKDVVGHTATVLRDHAKVSGFSPVGLELPFGPKADLPPIRFELANGIQMEIIGRIDRVDRAEGEQGMYLRVIDYKSSETKLSLTDVYFGLALQMLTYLDVVLTYADLWLGQGADPAGVLYFHVHHPMLKEDTPLDTEAISRKWFQDFKMKGLVLAEQEATHLMDDSLASGSSDIIPVRLKKDGDFYSNSQVATREQFAGLRDYVRGVIQQIGTDITNGEIDVSPYQLKNKIPCTYCSFKSVCQFDPTTEANDYRRLRSGKDEEMLKKMLEERGSNDGDDDTQA